MNKKLMCHGWFKWTFVATLLILVLFMSPVPLFVTSSICEFGMQSGRYRRTDFVCGVKTSQQIINSVLTEFCNYIENGENDETWVTIMKDGYKLPHDVIDRPYYETYRFANTPRAIDLLADFWRKQVIPITTQKIQAREFMAKLNQGQNDRDAYAFVLRIRGD